MTMRIDQHFWPDSDGQAGQTLVTDGAGNLGWSDIDVAQQGLTIIVPGVFVSGTYMAVPTTPTAWTLDRFMVRAGSGSCALTMRVNGTAIPDLTDLAVAEVNQTVDLAEAIPAEAELTYVITDAALADLYTVLLYTPS